MADVYGERWRIARSLGEGGQAQTFLVTDTRGASETPYVLKRLKNIDRLERFKREIEVVRNLNHPHIIRLIDFDLQDARPYLVTEYCAGGALSSAQPFWRGNISAAFSIFLDICEALKYAHAQRVVHRDIKPANVFLRSESGPAVLGDFGICYIEEGTRITLIDEAVGARLFIPPEFEDGRADLVSDKSDVYSLGKLLYWLLSGGEVFSREKHRESTWDLKGKQVDSLTGWDNIYMEHANRLLDLMVVPNPSDRRPVDNIMILARRAARLMTKEFSPIAKDIGQPCLYCGQGVYVLRVSDTSDVRNFGYEPIGDADWRVFTCSACGHVQSFRIEKIEHKEWWD